MNKGGLQASSLEVPAGITAHSTRSTATSAAFKNCASVVKFCKAATWSSDSTFVQHYKLNIFDSADATFGRKVLQQVVAKDSDGPPSS